ncbi:MAG: insulinase family protein [Candidatus Kapabacteria bacterium]|nr:insulinase family protein [Candidatus Kapabacteria bacterium]
MIDLKTITLQNGLRVVVAPNHKAPVVNVTVAYKVGSKDERIGKTGLAHLFEHLMFDNIKGKKDLKFDVYLTEAGGESNAYTTYDYTLYHLTVPSTHVELGVWLEAQRMAEFVVPQRALDTQINVVSEEILQTVKNQPYGSWRELQAATAYSPDCPYNWEVHGSREDVQGVSYQDALAWYQGYYRPDNAVLVLAGDITVQKATELAEQYFAPIQHNNNSILRNTFVTAQRKTGHVTEQQNVPHNAVFLSFHFDGFTNEQTLAADVLAMTLGGGRSSRLFKKLMFEKQMVLDIGCYADKREHHSLLTAYAFAANESITCDMLADALTEELQDIVTNGVTEQELRKCQNKLRTSVAYELQHCTGVAEAAAQSVLFYNDAERINTLLNKYASITIDDVRAFTQQTLQLDSLIRTDIIAA